MKKLLFVLVIMSFAGLLLADDIAIAGNTTPTAGVKSIIVYDAIKHTETGSNVFMLWGGASVAIGIVPTFQSSVISKGFGFGMIGYGIVETAMAIYDKDYGVKITDQAQAKAAMTEKSGFHSVLGLVQIVAGASIAALADKSLKGYGMAMALQGSFFAISDGLNFYISKDPGTVRDWNAGVTYRFQLASMDFYAR
jgi:hypothetical protein